MSDGELILGKFLAAIVVLGTMLVLAATYPILLALVHPVDFPSVTVGYLGLFLLGAAFLAVGTFVSSLTESQLVAGVVTFGTLLIARVGIVAGPETVRDASNRFVGSDPFVVPAAFYLSHPLTAAGEAPAVFRLARPITADGMDPRRLVTEILTTGAGARAVRNDHREGSAEDRSSGAAVSMAAACGLLVRGRQ